MTQNEKDGVPMTSIDLKEEVRRAIGGEWEGFVERHPRLAEVMDQQAMVEQAAAQIADDPEYQKAMAEAQSQGLIGSTLIDLVRGFVKDWLVRLV